MNSFIVDASIALKWALEEEHGEASRRLRQHVSALYAPDFLWTEVASVICQRVQRRQLAAEEAHRILFGLRAVPIHLTPSADLLNIAFALALETGASTYDCLYLALAILLDGTVVTADRQFLRKLQSGPYRGYINWVAEIS